MDHWDEQVQMCLVARPSGRISGRIEEREEEGEAREEGLVNVYSHLMSGTVNGRESSNIEFP